MFLTQSSIVPMFPAWTPQSIRMYCGPASVGTVTKKKSPKPTRYMRTDNLSLLLPLALGGCFADFFAAFLVAFLVAFFAAFFVVFLAAFFVDFLVDFFVAIFRILDEADQS